MTYTETASNIPSSRTGKAVGGSFIARSLSGSIDSIHYDAKDDLGEGGKL